MHRVVLHATFVAGLTLSAATAAAVEPWIITDDVVVTEPMEVGDVRLVPVETASMTARMLSGHFEVVVQIALVNASIDTWNLYPAHERCRDQSFLAANKSPTPHGAPSKRRSRAKSDRTRATSRLL